MRKGSANGRFREGDRHSHPFPQGVRSKRAIARGRSARVTVSYRGRVAPVEGRGEGDRASGEGGVNDDGWGSRLSENVDLGVGFLRIVHGGLSWIVCPSARRCGRA